MSSPRAEELLRQILATPDDLELRAVYADELQAAGDPRGEFIALELANDPAHAGRRISLLAKHARQWWPELPRHRIAMRAGFVERVAGLGKEMRAAARLFATEPINDVTLLDGDASSIVEWPFVRRLAVRGANAAELAALIERRGAELVAFDLRGCRIEAARVAPLRDALPACRELYAGDNPHLGRSLPVLLDWAHLHRVEVLDLGRTMLVPEVLAELLARDLPTLRVLRLSGNPFGPLPRPIIAALAALPALERLELVDCELDDDTISVLSRVCPRRVRTAFNMLHMPERIAIDAIATQLELVRIRPMRWAIDVDGVRRTIRWQHLRTEENTPTSATDWKYEEAASIEWLASAVACGAAPILAEHEPRLSIALGTTQTGLYATSIFVQRSATLEYAPTTAPISITLHEHVERD